MSANSRTWAWFGLMGLMAGAWLALPALAQSDPKVQAQEGVDAPAALQAPAELQARARAALATLDGTLHVHGLHRPVRVRRDRWGVAHIYAADQHDLFFAQGFVVSQDRLFQMEMWKRAGQGRLAEVLGPGAVDRDLNARRLRYRGDMQAEFSSYAPDTEEILTAFTDGINAYIARLAAPDGPGLPVEFQMAGFAPEPWQPSDCLNRLAAYSMTSNATLELQHAQVLTLLGNDAASGLFDLDPKVKLDPKPGVDYSGLSSSLLDALVGSDARIAVEPKRLRESNDWTVSGALRCAANRCSPTIRIV